MLEQANAKGAGTVKLLWQTDTPNPRATMRPLLSMADRLSRLTPLMLHYNTEASFFLLESSVCREGS